MELAGAVVMLLSADETLAISNLGWVDRGNLWAYDVRARRERLVRLGDAQYLSLHPGTEDHFAAAHHYDGTRFEITVHHFKSLDAPLARAVIDSNGARLTGDVTAWTHVPLNYTGYHKNAAWQDFCLIRVHPANSTVELQQFGWYDQSFDKGYQGIVGVTEIPRSADLLISVQRSSKVIVYDPVKREQVGAIALASRAGNPNLYFSRFSDELWADDYDTLLRLEAGSWKRLRSKCLAPAFWSGTMQFIGRFWLNDAETMCVVARPFSSDVIVVNPKSLRTVATCKTDRQPIEAIVVAESSMIGRDWKTGALVAGKLRRTLLALTFPCAN